MASMACPLSSLQGGSGSIFWSSGPLGYDGTGVEQPNLGVLVGNKRDPSLMRRRRRAAGPQQEVPRPPPGVATGQGCPGHLHQLEDVVRLPILGHFRGDAVRGGGRVHIAVQRVRSLLTAVARAARHQRAPLTGDGRRQGCRAVASSARVAPAHRRGWRLAWAPAPPPASSAAWGKCFPALASSAPLCAPPAGHLKSPPAVAFWGQTCPLIGPPCAERPRGHVDPREGGRRILLLVPSSRPGPGVRSSLSHPGSALWASVSSSSK